MSLSKNINPSLVLVQPRKTCPFITERLLMGRKESNQTKRDCCEWKLTKVDPQERSTWRSGVRFAMRAASQIPGKGPTEGDDAPAPAR